MIRLRAHIVSAVYWMRSGCVYRRRGMGRYCLTIQLLRHGSFRFLGLIIQDTLSHFYAYSSKTGQMAGCHALGIRKVGSTTK